MKVKLIRKALKKSGLQNCVLPMCGFIAQLVEHRAGIAEVTGSNPVEALIFFQASFQLLKLENLLRWSLFTLICQDCFRVRGVRAALTQGSIFLMNTLGILRPDRASEISFALSSWLLLSSKVTWNEFHSLSRCWRKMTRTEQPRVWVGDV